jgi:hypothetical protein
LCTEAFEVCYSACGVNIERELNDNMVYDNRESIRSSSGNVSERGLPLFNFPKDLLEDLKFRTLLVMDRDQMTEYMQTEENVEKMKKKRYPLSKQYKDFNLINLSFYTRHCTLESTIFGDPTEEEPNLAYSILKSVKKVSVFSSHHVYSSLSTTAHAQCKTSSYREALACSLASKRVSCKNSSTFSQLARISMRSTRSHHFYKCTGHVSLPTLWHGRVHPLSAS